MRAVFVAPASHRQFFDVSVHGKSAGETPALPNLFATICFGSSLGVSGAMVAHEG
jgi:hypothetical protein